MFEKIFGIFRKRKKADVSQEIPGDTGEDMFDVGDVGFGDEFDADTISLETGMSDGGFSGSSGGEAGSGPDLGEPIGVTEPPVDEELGLGMDFGEEVSEGAVTGEEIGEIPEREAPISPPPEVEEYAPPKRGRGIKGVLVMVAVAVVGLVIGFFGVKPAMHVVQKILTSGPTPAEQLAAFQEENAQLEAQLTDYRAVGTIDDIVAVRNELEKRAKMSKEMSAIEAKIADQATVEERLDQLTARLDETNRELTVQKGSLANVQKGIKQIEARNNYLISSTRKRLDQIEADRMKSEVLRARLEPERVERAEAEASLTLDIQEGLKQTTTEALSEEALSSS